MRDTREAIQDTREQLRVQEEARRQEEERARKAAMQMKLDKLRQDKDIWMQQQRMQAMARLQGYPQQQQQQQQGFGYQQPMAQFQNNGFQQHVQNGYQQQQQLPQEPIQHQTVPQV